MSTQDRSEPFKPMLIATIGLGLLMAWFGSLGHVLVVVLALWLPWPLAAGCLFRTNIGTPTSRFTASLLLGFSLASTIFSHGPTSG